MEEIDLCKTSGRDDIQSFNWNIFNETLGHFPAMFVATEPAKSRSFNSKQLFFCA